MKKILLPLLLLSTSAQAEYMDLNVKPFPVGCQKGVTCNIAAEHRISLQNTSNETRSYTVTYKICVAAGCTQKQDIVKLKPGQPWNNRGMMNHYVTFNHGGNYTATYFTILTSNYFTRDVQQEKVITINH